MFGIVAANNPNESLSDTTTNAMMMTTTTTTTPATTSSALLSSSSSSSSYSVLSEKVNRALAVRTDTPAMKAALDALNHLERSTASSSTTISTSALDFGTTNSSSDGVIVDSRNVRVAIEYDALQQALHLQSALQSIVGAVQELRVGISSVTVIAQQIRQAAHQQVDIVGGSGGGLVGSISNKIDTSNMMLLGTLGSVEPTVEEGIDLGNNNSNISGATTNDTENKEPYGERKLASILMDAFIQRDNARKRLQAITEFMEKFDLSERDSYLLDHYNFEDRMYFGMMSNSSSRRGSSSRTNKRFGSIGDDSKNNDDDADAAAADDDDGIAFLKALERVRTIRNALQKQTLFGGDLHGTGINNNNTEVDDFLSRHALGLDGTGTTTTTTSSRSSSSSAAIRMMEKLAEKQERAYERLYHWLQKYLNLFPKGSSSNTTSYQDDNDVGNSGDDPYNNSAGMLDEMLTEHFVRMSIYMLRHVPAFYSHTIELIATSRRTEVTRRFLLALTSGYDHLPPIEMKSHDTVAYVGDMLAFSFRAFSVEADVAKGLLEFNLEQESDNENKETTEGVVEKNAQSRKASNDEDNDNYDDDDDMKAIEEDNDDDEYEISMKRAMDPREMLSISMSGLARPLKSRIMHVIMTLARRTQANVDRNKHNNRLNEYGTNDNDDDDDDADDYDGITGDDDFGEECTRFRTKIANLYDVCGLLLFYTTVMDKTMDKLQINHTTTVAATARVQQLQQQQTHHSSNPLISSLKECFHESVVSYEATVRVYCAMLEQWSTMTGETQSSLAYSLLVRIADVRVNSPGLSNDILQQQQQQQPQDDDVGIQQQITPSNTSNNKNVSYRTILSIEWITKILFDTCISKCNALNDIVHLNQALSCSINAGMDSTAANNFKEMIQSKEVILIDELVTMEVTHVLELCGLGMIVSSYQSWKEQWTNETNNDDDNVEDDSKNKKIPMAYYPGLTQSIVENTMKEFYTSLYSPPIPTLEGTIQDPIMRRNARTKISLFVSQLYTELYHTIIHPTTGHYNNPMTFLEHTPEQVQTLFSA